MYETEANSLRESSAQLPSHVLAMFGELRASLAERTVLPWSEHCTECVWPSCYSTCDMYSPREDGRCRRFVDGMVRIDCPDAVNSYLLKVTFKRWAKLWTPGNIRLRTAKQALAIEKRDFRIGSTLYHLPIPGRARRVTTEARYKLKKKFAQHPDAPHTYPEAFLFECFNPEQVPVKITFCIRPVGETGIIPFEELLVLIPGFHRVRIPCSRIQGLVNLNAPFNIEIIPNDSEKPLTLYFGLLDFVTEKQDDASANHNLRVGQITAKATATPKVKCVVWDLDNTIWDGILMEDGQAGLSLKPGIRAVLEELDRRGILLSVASKNNHDEALAALQRSGLAEFFLVPQISWGPKSEAIRAIARRLNIGLDTLLFVDDSEFELHEVGAALPDVRVLNAHDYREIPSREDCKVPVTAESRNRRVMYQIEAERETLASSFAGDYTAFLRNCSIRLTVKPLDNANLSRVHELTQRTNQMNFSGNRYDRERLRQILSTTWLDGHVLEVEDRFGSYGIVGFALVDSREPCITDLMFSCRIQSKRVEHAVLGWLIRKYGAARDVFAAYRKTERNAPSGKVFADIGMEEVDNADGVSRLVFRHTQPLPDEGIVTIVVPAEEALA